jgi:hypothetical protein
MIVGYQGYCYQRDRITNLTRHPNLIAVVNQRSRENIILTLTQLNSTYDKNTEFLDLAELLSTSLPSTIRSEYNQVSLYFSL